MYNRETNEKMKYYFIIKRTKLVLMNQKNQTYHVAGVKMFVATKRTVMSAIEWHQWNECQHLTWSVTNILAKT